MSRFISYPDRNAAIDGLRGISILLVILTHLDPAGAFAAPLVMPGSWWHALTVNGGLGVSLFLSSRATSSPARSWRATAAWPAINVREFFVFRASRILPALLLLVGLNLLALALRLPGFELPPPLSLATVLAHVFTFRFNVLFVHGGAQLLPWAPLWSLAIEEVFYLAFPLVAIALRRTWLLVPFFAGIAVYGFVYRDHNEWPAFYLYWGCFDQLALGCLTALAAHLGRHAAWPTSALRALQVAGAVVIGVVYFSCDLHENGNWVWLPTGMALGASLFLLGSPATGARSLASRLSRPIGLAGFLSYELYLFHVPVLLRIKVPLQALGQATGHPLPADVVYLAVVSVLVLLCGVLHTWFSEPVLHGMRRVFAPAARASSPAAPLA